LEDTSHPSLLRVYELLHDEQHFYIITEYLKYGELYEYMVARPKSKLGALTENEIKDVAKQIFYGLCYMHSRNIAHRDLKPENILVGSIDKGSNVQIKISDFGFAQYYKPEKKMKDVLGTPLYTAPEIIDRKSYDSKVDIWSSTIVIYIMLTGKQPFMGNTKDSLFNDITSRELDFKSE